VSVAVQWQSSHFFAEFALSRRVDLRYLILFILILDCIECKFENAIIHIHIIYNLALSLSNPYSITSSIDCYYHTICQRYRTIPQAVTTVYSTLLHRIVQSFNSTQFILIMGCTSSTQNDVTDPSHPYNKSSQSSSQSSHYGNGSNNLTTDPAEKERIAKQQRRKLSVAPQHVGDIQGQDRKGSLASGADTLALQQQQQQNSRSQQQQQAASSASASPALSSGHPLLDADELMFTGSALSAADIESQQQIHHCTHGTRSRKGIVPYNRNKYVLMHHSLLQMLSSTLLYSALPTSNHIQPYHLLL
jgi:hypothetical protein